VFGSPLLSCIKRYKASADIEREEASTSKKRLAVIIDNLSYGGAQVQTIELLNRLCKSGFEILVLSLGNETDIMGRLDKDIEAAALNKKMYMDPFALYRIVKYLRCFKPDGLLMVNTYSMMYGCLSVMFSDEKPKMTVVMHTTVIRSLKEKLQNFLIYKRLINKMRRIVFVCDNQRQHWINKYGINYSISRVIYNGIDTKRYSGYKIEREKIRTLLGFMSDDIVIGINACLRPEKKHEDLIDAASLLISNGYKIKVLMVGDGQRRRFLENHIHLKKLLDKVIITGFVDEVRPYIACMDIMVLCSTAVESFSMAVLEGMAMAKPVVISDTGGASELVEHMNNGVIYPPAQIEKLYASLKYIIDNNLFAIMGERSQKKVEELYGIEKMVKGYIDIL